MWGHGYSPKENVGGVYISIKEKCKTYVVENNVLIQGIAQYIVMEGKGT